MIIKRMLKFSLCGFLLAVSASAYAQEGAEEVLLADGTKTSWSNFVGVINNPSSLAVDVDSTALHTARENYAAALKEANEAPGRLTAATNSLHAADSIYKQANDSLDAYKEERNNMSESQKYTTGPVGWLKTIRTSATQFQTDFNSYYNTDGTTGGDKGSISYYLSGSDRWGYKLFVSFSGIPTGATVGDGTTGWKENANVGTFDDALYSLSGKTNSTVSLYLGQTDGVNNYPDNDGLYVLTTYNVSSSSQFANSVVSAINTLAKEDGYYEQTLTPAFQTLSDSISTKTARVKILSERQGAAQRAYNEASAAVTNSTSRLSSTKATFDEALSKYNQDLANAGNAINNYLNVTLLTDITASTPVTKAYSGSIDADGHIIAVSDGVNLFGTSYFANGQLHNAIINGVFATGGKYYNVAAWRGANGIYYDENGNNAGTLTNIGKLAFDNRDLRFFSADIAGKQLVKWSATNQVYDITMYQVDATTQFYTNVKDGAFVNNPISDYPVNTFFESKTNDFGDINNVIVDKVCKNVVIEDKKEFYSPYDFTATNVTLNRTFKVGYNTVCLPFELKYSYSDNIEHLCTYHREVVNKFWFTQVTPGENRSGSIPANTPALMVVKDAAITSLNLSGIIIKRTPEDQIVMLDRDETNHSKSFGTFISAGRDQFAGGFNAYKVFGLSGETFQPAGASASFPAFRAVISSELVEQGTTPAPRSIGIVDEMGIEINGITTGVDNLELESAMLDVVGAQGEIIITTEADYGKVEIYTANGSLATVANVMSGTTTVSLPSGIYIVMGKKVMVK